MWIDGKKWLTWPDLISGSRSVVNREGCFCQEQGARGREGGEAVDRMGQYGVGGTIKPSIFSKRQRTGVTLSDKSISDFPLNLLLLLPLNLVLCPIYCFTFLFNSFVSQFPILILNTSKRLNWSGPNILRDLTRTQEKFMNDHKSRYLFDILTFLFIRTYFSLYFPIFIRTYFSLYFPIFIRTYFSLYTFLFSKFS